MKQQKRKGFTLVELLVVIAILAVLATVSIIGYTSFIKRAKISNDMALVKQINDLLLASETVDGKPATMQEALDVIEENGFLIENLTPTAQGYDYIWNCKTNRFLLLNENREVVAPVDAKLDEANSFVVVHNEAEIAEWAGYHLYLAKDFALDDGNTELAVSTDVDAGESKNISIEYSNPGDAQNVVIRTNGGNLTVNAPNDTVHHHGNVENLVVEAVGLTDCYHEYGFVKTFVSFGSGKFVAHPGAKFHQSQADIEAVLGDNQCELAGAAFAEHYYDENGVCVGCDSVNENHVHAWSDWTMDNSNHYRACSACNTTESGAHEWEGNTCTVCSMTYVNATSITIEPKNPSDNITWYPGDSLGFSAKVEPADAMGTVEWKMKTPTSSSGYKYFEVDNEGTVNCLNSTSTEKYLILTATVTNLDGTEITAEYTLPKTTSFYNIGIYTTNHTGDSRLYPVYNVGDEIIFDLSPIINFGGEFKFVSFNLKNGSGVGDFTDGIFDPVNKTLTVKATATSIMQTNSPTFILTFSRNGIECSLEAKSHPKVREKIYFNDAEFTGTMSKNMTINETCTVTAPEFAERFAGKTIEWSSANESIVKIDSQGNIIAVGAGQTTIFGKITLDNGEVYTIKQTIKVK